MGKLLNSKEKAFFDKINFELMALAGHDYVVLWKFSPVLKKNPSNPSIDCLYEEPAVNSRHYTSYSVMGFFEQPDSQTDVGDNGLIERVEGRFWFNRKDLEQRKVPVDEHGDHINPGDIIQIFPKGQEWYFEVVNANRDGFEHDSEVWTQYSCDVVRNESFSPERKLLKV